jgi:hypothetical protein
MKEKVPLDNPFIGEPRGGRAASSCGQSPSILSKNVMIELKREIVEGKGGKEGKR